MTRESEHQINFEVTQEVLKAEKNRVSNYFPNPEKNWGPKRAAAIVIPREEVEKKKKVHTEETRVDGAGESGSPSQSDDERGPEDDEAEQ
jgi:hypothetical protein